MVAKTIPSASGRRGNSPNNALVLSDSEYLAQKTSHKILGNFWPMSSVRRPAENFFDCKILLHRIFLHTVLVCYVVSGYCFPVGWLSRCKYSNGVGERKS